MLQKLIKYFKPYLQEGVCIAFSGGADSSLLLKAACMARENLFVGAVADTKTLSSNIANAPTGNNKTPDFTQQNADLTPAPPILAIIAETRLHPHEDTIQAEALARSMGADCTVLKIDEFADSRIMHNPQNRCYLCKTLLFSSIKKAALENGRLHVFDGTNQNDTKEYRPGLAALEELGIHSPLKELGITKEQVRECSRRLQLVTSDKPSAPCLATRLPYGAKLDFALLNNLHEGESWLRSLGFYNVRLRFHEPLLRLEVDKADFEKVLEHQEAIVSYLKQLGFLYVTLDLEGFRSGSMDIM